MSSPARLTRAETKALTRVRILEAARVVFPRDGYHRASLDRVAAEAGFTKGAVYSAFASKADLFLALLAERAASRRADAVRAAQDATTAEEFVARVAGDMARSTSGERAWWAVVIEFMTVVGRDPELQRRYAEHHDATRDLLAAELGAWAERTGRAFAMDTHAMATAALALTNGLTLEALLAPANVPDTLYVDAHLALLKGAQR